VSLLVYGITDRLHPGCSNHGLGETRLRAISEDGLFAIVAERDGMAIEPTVEALCEYEQAIERLMAGEVLLPARFASVLANEDSVRSMLRGRAAELRGALDRIRGAVEFGITAGWRTEMSTVATVDSGRAYLLAQLARHRRASEIAELLESLASIARSSRHRVLPRPGLPVTGAYLVDERDAEEFIELVAHVDEELTDADLVCTGPWPPFSFAEEVSG
jgi:hypothetical protein